MIRPRDVLPASTCVTINGNLPDCVGREGTINCAVETLNGNCWESFGR